MLAALASSTISHKDRFTQAIHKLHCSTSLQQISSVSAYINQGSYEKWEGIWGANTFVWSRLRQLCRQARLLAHNLNFSQTEINLTAQSVLVCTTSNSQRQQRSHVSKLSLPTTQVVKLAVYSSPGIAPQR